MSANYKIGAVLDDMVSKFDAAQSAALVPTREVPGVVADSQSRLADIFCLLGIVVIQLLLMFMLFDLTLHEAATTLGHALNVGVHRKLTAHLASYHAAGVEFIPIVAESLDDLAKDTIFTVLVFFQRFKALLITVHSEQFIC